MSHRCMPGVSVVGKGGALRGLHPAGQDAQKILRDASQQCSCLPPHSSSGPHNHLPTLASAVPPGLRGKAKGLL